MGLEPHSTSARRLSLQATCVSETDRDHWMIDPGRREKVGWTMGLEPYSITARRLSLQVSCVSETDRDHRMIDPGRREKVGWTMGLEPTTTGITTRGSTN